jgi:hypothetical protein
MPVEIHLVLAVAFLVSFLIWLFASMPLKIKMGNFLAKRSAVFLKELRAKLDEQQEPK